MHLSRMRIARLLPISHTLRWWWRWGCLLLGGGCLLWGVSASRGSAPGEVCSWKGCLLLGGGSAPGGLLLVPGDVSQYALWQTALPVNRMTDRCKHITLFQTSFAGCNYAESLYYVCAIFYFICVVKIEYTDSGKT